MPNKTFSFIFTPFCVLGIHLSSEWSFAVEMSTVRQPGASSACWKTIIRLNQEWSVNKNRLCCAITENQQLLHGTQSDNDLCFCSECLCIWLCWPCVLHVPLYVCECVSSFIKGNEVTCYVWTCFDRMPCQMSVLLSVSCPSHDTQTHARTHIHTHVHALTWLILSSWQRLYHLSFY